MNDKTYSLKYEYQLRFSKHQEYRANVWKILCKMYFQNYISENSIIIDVGAGWGEFINNIRGEVKYAMDLNPDTKGCLTKGIIFLQQDCSQKWPIETESLDVVFTSNFIEHLSNKDSLELMILEAFRCLKEGGKIICLGPNIKYARGAYWDFWDHCIPLTELSLSELLKMNAFNIELCLPRFLPYSMSLGRTPPLIFVKLYIMLPIIWFFFGKQFLVIGKKRGSVE